VSAIAFMQREIQESAYRYQAGVEAKARIVVGVNEFVMDEPPPANLFQGDPRSPGPSPIASAGFRQSRHAATAAQALEAIELAAGGRDNLIPLILDGVRARLTLVRSPIRCARSSVVHQPSVVF